MTELLDLPLSPETFETLTQFGVAGLMGVLWVWERMHSRQRDTQLTQSHQRIVGQRERLGVMAEMIRHNAETLEQLNQTHDRLTRLMEAMSDRLDALPPHYPRQRDVSPKDRMTPNGDRDETSQ